VNAHSSSGKASDASGEQQEVAFQNPATATGVPEGQDPRLTWRQRKILQVIRDWVQLNGYPPSLREIAEAAGLASKSSVSYHLSILQEKGYLRRDAGRPRTVDAWPEPEFDKTSGSTNLSSLETVLVPLMGQIPAGVPVFPQQPIEEALPLPRQLVGDGDLFVLTVSSDSMINVGIFSGDWVVVRQQSVAENGEIVAAMVDGESMVRTYMRTGRQVWLVPHHPAHTPIPGDRAEILGKVVTVLRRM
jgi:repressor LexA